MDAPQQIKIAILLSWLALVLDSVSIVYSHIQNSTETDDCQFHLILAAVTLVTIIITATFIFFAARRHNWARLGLLFWTLGSWALWFYWPSVFADYSWWEWLASAVLVLLEFAALVLLFFGKGGKWYSSVAVE
jgi:hypothetical protein